MILTFYLHTLYPLQFLLKHRHLEEHFEQQVHVAGKLKRHGAGIKMQYCETTPESLARTVLDNIGGKVTYGPISADGAKKAAKIILDQL